MDEVEGMSPALQIKLLRVIQEREIMHVGGDKIIIVDVRIIAASNETLEELVNQGTFKSDLYYRLSTLPINIPPLGERGDDIMILFEHIKKLGGKFILSPQVKKRICVSLLERQRKRTLQLCRIPYLPGQGIYRL